MTRSFRVPRILVAVLVAICTVSVLANAQMPAPPCKWGAATYTRKTTALSGSLKITVPCGGGIVGCRGKLASSYWVWDPISLDWQAWDQSHWEVWEPFKNCGSTYSYTEMIGHPNFPPSSFVCITFDWYEWNGTGYTWVSQGNNAYWTP